MPINEVLGILNFLTGTQAEIELVDKTIHCGDMDGDKHHYRQGISKRFAPLSANTIRLLFCKLSFHEALPLDTS